VLDKEASLLDPLNGITDQYCAKRVGGLGHRKAVQEAREELLRSMEAMQSTDTE